MKLKMGITILAAAGLWGQTAGPKWEEFSIGAPAPRMRVQNLRNGIRAESVPLRKVLARAFGVPEYRIFGPDWMADDRYALTALAEDPKDFQPLMQRELAARFQMLAHRETRVVPVFVLKPSDAPAKMTGSNTPAQATISGASDGRNSIKLAHMTVAAFANALSDAVGRPVLDETHLDGAYDFILNWQLGSNSALHDAIKNQLGLELADDRRPVDLVVIDHIEKVNFPQ